MPNVTPIHTLHRKFSRRKSPDLFKKVIKLRKKQYSYTEIRKETGLAKSTIQNWLTYSGLTLTKEHLEIQLKKQIEKKGTATEASKRTRQIRRELYIQKAVDDYKKIF